jgi:hypothetical protein
VTISAAKANEKHATNVVNCKPTSLRKGVVKSRGQVAAEPAKELKSVDAPCPTSM